MKKLKFSLIIAIIGLIAISGCVKDNFNFDLWDREVSYDASFAFPALWGDLAFTDALKKYEYTGMLIKNSDGYISLQYKARVSSNKVNEILYLSDQNFNGNIFSPEFNFSNFNSFGDTVSFAKIVDMPFTMFNPEAEIDSLTLKSGIMNMLVTSTFKHSAKLYLTFPTVTKNGVPFKRTFTFVAGGGSVVSLENDLTGYKIDMTQTATGFNEIPVEMRLTLYWSGTSDNSGNLSTLADITNLTYSIMYGYFGINTLFFESDTIDVNLFKDENFEIERYHFEDPKLLVKYWNSYGVPSQFYFTHMVANSALDNIDYDIIDFGVGLPIGVTNPYNVAYSSTPNQVKHDSLVLNKNNSNIAQILNKRPRWIQFKAKATTNPIGLTHNNFVTDKSLIEVEVSVELPLWGYIYNFNMRDTLEADLRDLFRDNNPVKRALLRIDIQNGFPVEAYSQVYFLDQNYVILDSLFHSNNERLLTAANVDNNGRVLDFSRKVTKIEYDTQRLEKLRTCKYVVYEAHANTTQADQNKLSRIYEEYRIKFDIGFEADLSISGNIDSLSNL